MLREIGDARNWNEDIKEIADNIEYRLKNQLIDETQYAFTRLQKKAIHHEAFWERPGEATAPNLIIQGATSSGKTLLSELSILDYLNDGKKALVLVPLRSMVRERSERFRSDMGGKYNVFASSGDYLDYDAMLINGDYDVGVMVYEKFFSMLNQEGAGILKDCRLVIVDEMTMLNQDERGPKLEMAIEIARIKNPKLRIMCLVTTDCSVHYVEEWLKSSAMQLERGNRFGGRAVVRDVVLIEEVSRPVGLDEYIVNIKDASYEKRHIPGENELNIEYADSPFPEMKKSTEPLIQAKIPRLPGDRERKDFILVELLRELKSEESKDGSAKILVFAGTQKRTRQIAELLSKNELFPIQKLPADFKANFDRCDHDDDYSTLRKTLFHGIAFHNSSMSASLRELIESDYQKKSGSCIKVIVATETLTIGINMPIDYMIMMDHEVPRGKGEGAFVALDPQEYRNYIGRAGRLGLTNRCGRSYIFLPSESEILPYRNSLSRNQNMCKPVESALTWATEKELAPFYLGLLINRRGENGNFQPDDLKYLFEQSLAQKCLPSRNCNGEKICESMYDTYLIDEADEDEAVLRTARGKKVSSYKLEPFGKQMALFALSTDTCARIYWFFVDSEGRKKGGLPLSVTADNVGKDIYLLDILYLVCLHKEVQESSNILIPSDSRNPVMHAKALEAIKNALKKIYPNWMMDATYTQTEDTYQAWSHSLLDIIKPDDEHMQALLRAIVMYYWTKGYESQEIRKVFSYDGYDQAANNGDIERIAEVVSFHLEAVYRAVQDPKLKVAFNTLSRRVKYGVPQNLVCIANRHVFGLERLRILEFGKYANSNYDGPVDCLKHATSTELEPFFTGRQRELILERMDQRLMSERISFMSLMDNIEDSLNGDFPERFCLQRIHNIQGPIKQVNLQQFDEDIKKILLNENYTTGFVFPPQLEKARPAENVWRFDYYRNEQRLFSFILAIYDDEANPSESIDNAMVAFHNADSSVKRILVAQSEDSLNSAIQILDETCKCQLAMTFQCFARLLSFKFGEQKYEIEIADMLNDLRGVLTSLPFSPLNYSSRATEPNAKFQILINYESASNEHRPTGILWKTLQDDSSLKSYNILPWGKNLTRSYNRNLPTIILATRHQVVQSNSITRFIGDMNRENCRVVFADSDTRRRWKSEERYEFDLEAKWRDSNKHIIDFPGNYFPASYQAEDLKDCIYDFVFNYCDNDTSETSAYKIGICFSRYDADGDNNHYKTDEECFISLVKNLIERYGHKRVLLCTDSESEYLFCGEPAVSLEEYKKCRFFLVLWNKYTETSEPCKRELRVIRDTVNNSHGTKAYWYVQGNHEDVTPHSSYKAELPENEEQQVKLLKMISQELRRLEKKSAEFNG